MDTIVILVKGAAIGEHLSRFLEGVVSARGQKP